MKLKQIDLKKCWCFFFLFVSHINATSAFGKARSGFSLGVQSYGYLATSNLEADGKNTVLPGFFGAIDWETIGDRFEGAVKAEGFLSGTGIKNSYLLFEELYMSSSQKWSDNQFSVGRRHFYYSALDSNWDLGVFQPRARWDQFNVREMGLSGFFYSRKLKNFDFSVYISPVLIPEQSSEYEFDEVTGVISSANPFDPIPPRQKGLASGSPLPIRYSLNTKDIVDNVIVKAGGGARARLGAPTGVWGQAAYAFKPMNQVFLSYDPFAIASAEKGLKVEVYPRVVYHHAISLDAGYRDADFSFWGGTLADFAVNDPKIQIHVNQEVSDSFFVSSGVSKKFRNLFFGSMVVSGSYLKRVGGTAPDSGDLTTGNHSLFETRFHLTEAIQNSISFNSKNGSEFLKLKALYDFPIQGLLLSAEVSIRPEPNWRIFLGGEFVGVGPDGDGGFDVSGGTNWFDRIRGTDRIRGGVTYVF